jgi:hypothetical protein
VFFSEEHSEEQTMPSHGKQGMGSAVFYLSIVHARISPNTVSNDGSPQEVIDEQRINR